MKRPASAPAKRSRPLAAPPVSGSDADSAAGAVGPARTPGWYAPLSGGVLAATALALLWTALRLHCVGDYFTESDFYGGYAEGARAIQHGHVDPARYAVIGPVYEFVLALVGALAGDLFRGGRLISVAAACGTLWLWGGLLRRRVGPAAGLALVALLAANPVFFRYGYSATTDMLATCLQAGALFALLTGTNERAPAWAGLLAALAFLTRYNSGVLLPAGLLLIAAGGTLHERRGRAALLFSAGFVVPVSAWVLFSFVRGTPLSFQLHHNIAYEVFARVNGVSWDDYQNTMMDRFHSLGDVIAYDPGAVAGRMLFNLHDHLRQDATVLLGVPAAVLVLAGLFLTFWDGGWKRLGPLALVGAFLYASLVPVFYSDRYSLSLAPIYLTLAALALTSPRLAIDLWGSRTALRWALAIASLALMVPASIAYQQARLDQLPFEVVEAGRALRRVAPPGARVVSRKGHISYYSGVELEPFPVVGTLAELADHCRRSRAGFIYFSWYEAKLRPEFVYLLDTTGVVPGLSVVFATDTRPAVVYRIGPGFGRDPGWFADDTLRLVHLARGVLKVGSGPRLWDSHIVLAMDALGHGRPAEALRHSLAGVELSPRAGLAWALRGEALRQMGRLPEALSAYQTALSLDPSSNPTRMGLARTLLALGHDEAASRALLPIVEEIRDPGLLLRVIETYDRNGDRAAGLRARRALEAIRPMQPRPVRGLEPHQPNPANRAGPNP
jgi:tetratricopeptide (TPR) repeat protein